MNRIFLLLAGLLLLTQVVGQETFPVNGTRDKEVTYTAFTHANIYVSHLLEIKDATLVIFDGKVVNAGKDVVIPSNTLVYDMTGMTIYPSFIDLDSDYGMPKRKEVQRDWGPHMTNSKKGAFGWNESIHPESDASLVFSYNKDLAGKLRAMGFGSVLTHQHDGIARGTGSLVSLGSEDHKNLLAAKASAHYSFRKGTAQQDYPSSLMGAIALLRQTYYDAKWYAEYPDAETNLSLEAWNELQSVPQIFEVGEKLDIFRADKIGDEFGVQYVFKTRGDEYQRLDKVKNSGASLIVPINYPAAFDVSDPFLTRMVSLTEMKHWEMAPFNCAMLGEAGIQFSITSNGLSDSKSFYSNLRKTVKSGLSKQDALAALTAIPAATLGMQNKIGHLNPGALANFCIWTGDLFEKESELLENWVQGERFIVKMTNEKDLSGDYSLKVGDVGYNLSVKGDPGKHKASIELISTEDTTQVKVAIKQMGAQVTLTFNPSDSLFNGQIRLAGSVHLASRIWDGKGQIPNGDWVEWVAIKRDAPAKEQEKKETEDSTQVERGNLIYPFLAFGWEQQPEAQTVLIQNATLWTCEEDGVVENGQILIHDGKIAAIGKNIRLSELFPKQKIEPVIIDAKGKHVSPGIIDEHSHIAVSRGVNEGTQASSAEVSIGTVVNSEDINIYRQLSGGVTASQLLHGSANPIGGQSGMIKLRWGLSPDEMLVQDAAPFIKFALGENVKQSNWGDRQTVRFPQTRMGVEQVYYDHFIQAREYGNEWNAYRSSLEKLTRRQKRNGEIPVPPRRDLEMETLLQILRSERFVTCHSYRQDEINMLMHVADSMGFTLNTFTHILEGYKVADKMANHGAGASSFSDWWAYKYEVKDAIPYNGALLHEQGIVTAFNSDDREMARRLNQEAAKAVKYGGVSEEEALKFVTLNPAKLLHLDHRMGSLKVGKDADLVIWSDNPLSIYAKAEKTFIDGRVYYDIEKDAAMRKVVSEERARLIQKMSGSDEKDEKKRKPRAKEDRHYHCDSEFEEMND